jgi:hypothetical protein
MDQSAERILASTPYLIADGRDAQIRYERVASRAGTIRERAISAAAAIAAEARRVLPQFEIAIRSDLVTESDRMEGIATSAREIRQLVQAKRELLEMDVSAFVQFVRDDERLLDSLGLYRAYALADEWAHAHQRPREFELRGLHSLVMPSLPSGGTYKAAPNEIEGSAHKPTAPWDVPREMSDLAAWFDRGCGDAALDAAVVHAWITHIHPFDDGNGRMARLLANLALIQAGYPPLLLRSQSDRGEYLDALAASDDGDILPLYDLFVSSLRRVVLTMEKPNYVQSKIRGDLLKTTEQRHEAWIAMATALLGCVQQKTKLTPWGAYEMGYPSLEHFDLLENRNHDGNCWYMKLRQRGDDRWLLWFGFRSDVAVDLLGERRCWPSIFIAERTDRADAVHPYETNFERDDLPSEIIISPGSTKPASIRYGLAVREMQIDEAAGVVVGELCA